MKVWRGAIALGVTAGGLAAAAPASAQFYLQHYDYSGAAVRGDEPGLAQPLPGATPDEMRAGLVWTMRSALNVAALQCQFEPTLLAVGNYNTMLVDHSAELKQSWDALGRYFTRTTKTKREGQGALDQFGTRTYSSFATVSSQYGFCRTAGSIGRDVLFTPRGGLGALAQARMRELRNSLVPYGEQRFARSVGYDRAFIPRLDPICWNKKGWRENKCGPLNWPGTAPVAVAAS